MSKLVQDLAKAMRTASGSKTKPADDTAVVRRIEGGTAWVHIPGGVDETPVEMTIDCKPGEAVKVRRAGGKAWLVGNGSAPPTDDTRANQVGERLEQKLEQNTQVITGDVRRVYKDVGSLSRNVDALGDDVETLDTLIRESSAGVEVGKVNSAGEYVAGHTLISAGDNEYQVIDENGNVVARFGASTVIGKENDMHSIVGSGSFSIVDGNGNVVARFGTSAVIGKVNEVHSIAGSDSFSVVDGNGNVVARFGAESTIRTSDGELLAKFGYSQKEQDDGTVAIAPFYLFGKGLEVSRVYGFAVGRYNLDGDYIFSVGRGTPSRRKNAFAVKPDGGIEIDGKTVIPLSKDLDAYIGSEFKGSVDDEYAPPSISIMRYGNVVELRGCVYPKATITGGVTQHTICTIPSGLGLRPSEREVVAVMQGSGQMHWCLRVKPDGTVTFSRAVNGSNYVDVTTSTWLPFHVTWITTYI